MKRKPLSSCAQRGFFQPELNGMHRARAVHGKFKTNLGRVIRQIKRQSPPSSGQTASLLLIEKRIHTQKTQDSGKAYSVQESHMGLLQKVKPAKNSRFFFSAD